MLKSSYIRLSSCLLCTTILCGCPSVHTTSSYTYTEKKTSTSQGPKKQPKVTRQPATYSSNQQIIHNTIINAPVGTAMSVPLAPARPISNTRYAPAKPPAPAPQPYYYATTNNAPATPPVNPSPYTVSPMYRPYSAPKTDKSAPVPLNPSPSLPQDLQTLEEVQMQEAIANSYKTKAEEDAKRAGAIQREEKLPHLNVNTPPAPQIEPYARPSLSQEELDMQRAIEASYETKAQEDAKRAAESTSQMPQSYTSMPNVDLQAPSRMPDSIQASQEDIDMQRAIEASLKDNPPSIPETLSISKEPPAPIQQEVAPIMHSKPEPSWTPNEGVLVQSGDNLMAHQKEKGSTLSRDEAHQHLQKDMNLTSEQAGTVLNELGIE